MRTIIITAGDRHRARLLCLCLLLPELTLAGTYVVTVSEDLDQLEVEARFERPTARFTARRNSAARYVSDARSCDRRRTASVRGRHLTVAAPGARCLYYRVDLRRAARAERRNSVLDAAIRVASPTVWLWRPLADPADVYDVEFVLPDGIDVAVPWLRIGTDPPTFRIPRSPQSGSAPAAFGKFSDGRLEVAGATLSLAVLASRKSVPEEKIQRWIAAAARNVSLAYGRFPNPDTRVFVIPAGAGQDGSRSPVHFGRVVRDGIEAVELYADMTRPLAEFHRDWTTTHEFSHLLLPYLSGRDRWVAEGFAQYYQNVLLARAGTYSAEHAWFKILSGLERGREARPDLSPNQAAARRDAGTRMKVYWAGAALMLLADVELRRRSEGRTSLDTALDHLQRCCLPSAASWSGTDLMTQLDIPSETAVFMPLYRQHADRPGFPNVAPLLRALGVSRCGETACLAADAELAPIRNAIMAVPVDVAAAR